MPNWCVGQARFRCRLLKLVCLTMLVLIIVMILTLVPASAMEFQKIQEEDLPDDVTIIHARQERGSSTLYIVCADGSKYEISEPSRDLVLFLMHCGFDVLPEPTTKEIVAVILVIALCVFGTEFIWILTAP